MKPDDQKALVLLVSGFVVWSVAFVALYGLQALGCAYGWGNWHRPILIGAYILWLLPLAWLSVVRLPTKTPLATSALWANRAALASGILVLFPVTFASICI